MIQFSVKIPVIENDSWVFDGDDDRFIELDDAIAVEMALANIQAQADDTYFDALLEIWIDHQLFFKEQTTDAVGLMLSLLDATVQYGQHEITFLDAITDLYVTNQGDYEFLYTADYICDNNDRVLLVNKELISSGPLPKVKVETAIVQLFKAFCEFFLQHDMPIAPEYKVSLQERRANL